MARHFLASITRNKISLAGVALAVASLTLILALLVIKLIGFEGGPYLGIVTFLGLPALFALGLIIIPVGVFFERRKMREHPEFAGRPPFPIIDLNNARSRQSVLVFLVLTIVNVVILSAATYKGVHVMETVEFCGATCHVVMEPEYTAYQRSAHARVTCAECHIGAGADWFVKSKISGSWQLVSVAFDLYPRPVPSPVENLRPARETCEECHWPTRYVGDKLVVKKVYAEDEANTESTTALLLHIGGVESPGAHGGHDEAHGIHWHVDPHVQIRYLADEKRLAVYDIELTDHEGNVKLFKNGEAPPDAVERGWRTMDCIDCHNRPTHRYRMPVDEVDAAIADGRLDEGLPFIRREAVRILEEEYASKEDAFEQIPLAVRAFYEEGYPDVAGTAAESIQLAADSLAQIWAWNVFPKMNVTWGTYPDHSNHQGEGGCFRCHDRKHATADGEKISRKCNLCHTVLAQEEEGFEVAGALK